MGALFLPQRRAAFLWQRSSLQALGSMLLHALGFGFLNCKMGGNAFPTDCSWRCWQLSVGSVRRFSEGIVFLQSDLSPALLQGCSGEAVGLGSQLWLEFRFHRYELCDFGLVKFHPSEPP